MYIDVTATNAHSPSYVLSVNSRNFRVWYSMWVLCIVRSEYTIRDNTRRFIWTNCGFWVEEPTHETSKEESWGGVIRIWV